MSRRSTTRPASPPVARTANRRPRTPRSSGARKASVASPDSPGREVDEREPPGGEVQLDRRLPAGQPEVAGLPAAADAAPDGEGADRHQGVGGEVAQHAPALVLVLDHAERGEQARRVERHLDDARPSEAVRQDEERGGRGDRRPGAAGQHHEVRGRTAELALGGLGEALERRPQRRRPQEGALAAEVDPRAQPQLREAIPQAGPVDAERRPRLDAIERGVVLGQPQDGRRHLGRGDRGRCPAVGGGLGPGAQRAAHPDVDELDPQVQDLGERGGDRGERLAGVGGAGPPRGEDSAQVARRIAVRPGGPAPPRSPAGSRRRAPRPRRRGSRGRRGAAPRRPRPGPPARRRGRARPRRPGRPCRRGASSRPVAWRGGSLPADRHARRSPRRSATRQPRRRPPGGAALPRSPPELRPGEPGCRAPRSAGGPQQGPRSRHRRARARPPATGRRHGSVPEAPPAGCPGRLPPERPPPSAGATARPPGRPRRPRTWRCRGPASRRRSCREPTARTGVTPGTSAGATASVTRPSSCPRRAPRAGR